MQVPAVFRDAGEYQRTFTRAMVEESCLLLQELARKLGRVLDTVGADGDLQRRHWRRPPSGRACGCTPTAT